MRYTLLLATLLFSCPGFAQHFLTGKVLKRDSKEFLISVSIENKTQRRHDLIFPMNGGLSGYNPPRGTC